MRKGISQEGLKLIACLTMLIDHIGYEIVYPLYSGISIVRSTDMMPAHILYNVYYLCRMVGRIAMPIFAFLLVEGFHHTRNRKRYILRLAMGALLSEIPYNLVISGEIFWQQQSVMVTLLLGLLALMAMERCSGPGWKAVVMLPFAVLAELLSTDYGWAGVVLVALFELSRELYGRNLVRTGGMIVLFHYMSSYVMQIGNFSIPMQVLGVLSMLFIANYDGRKLTGSRAVQWGFYLFYPVHLLLLWMLGQLLTGVYMVGISVVI